MMGDKDKSYKNFSDDFDKRERKIEDNPMDFIKQLLPIIEKMTTKPQTYKVTADLTASQLEEFAKLAQTWTPRPDFNCGGIDV